MGLLNNLMENFHNKKFEREYEREKAKRAKEREKTKEERSKANQLQICVDTSVACLRTMNETTSPDTFFECYDMCKSQAEKIDEIFDKSQADNTYNKLQKYLKSNPIKNIEASSFKSRIIIDDFIERLYKSATTYLSGCRCEEDAYEMREAFHAVWKYKDKLDYSNRENYKVRFNDLELHFNTIIERMNAHYDSMDGHEFEQFCADLLIRNGYTKAETTRGSGDYGVDILAEKSGITYAIQCKRYDSNVGNAAVQEIFSGREFYKRHVGVVMTNRYFTQSAIETAKRTGIVLWDREQLEEMLERNK